MVSVGTGAADPDVTPAKLSVENALKSLVALMGDCAQLQETMMPRMMAIVPKLQQASRDFMTQTMAKHAAAAGGAAPMPVPAAK